jgi:hypothetical protein
MSQPVQDERLVITSVRILPQERRELERIAALEDRSVSQVARRLLRDQLSRIMAADKQ